MSSVICPHCNATNSSGSAFCAVCGKAVPTGVGGPRLIGGNEFAGTATGRTLQAEELAKQANKAFGALLAVGVLQAIFGALVVAMIKSGTPNPLTPQVDSQSSLGALSAVLFGIAAIFLCLAFWAKKSPLPAAIVGLVLFITVHLLDAIADPTAIARGFLMKIIIIVVLVKAISAGAKHRTLMRAMAT